MIVTLDIGFPLSPFLVATEYAQQALGTDSSVWQVHEWSVLGLVQWLALVSCAANVETWYVFHRYAVSMGSLIKHRSTQEKIEKGFEYKVSVGL